MGVGELEGLGRSIDVEGVEDVLAGGPADLVDLDALEAEVVEEIKALFVSVEEEG